MCTFATNTGLFLSTQSTEFDHILAERTITTIILLAHIALPTPCSLSVRHICIYAYMQPTMYIHVHTFAHTLLNGTIHFGLLTSLFFAPLCAFSTLSEDDNNYRCNTCSIGIHLSSWLLVFSRSDQRFSTCSLFGHLHIELLRLNVPFYISMFIINFTTSKGCSTFFCLD